MANRGMKLDKRGERLTDRTIRTLKPRDKAYLVPDGRGLFLKIQPGGSRSWLVRYPADWSEIDLEGRLWVVPAERMKTGREHRAPLSAPATAILTALPGGRNGKVFPLSNMAMLALLRRMGRGDLTTHGFRSTFSDWCAEQTNFPAEVREMALAHAVGDEVEAAYRRGDLFAKRRELAEAWARFCTDEPGGRVVAPLRQAGSSPDV